MSQLAHPSQKNRRSLYFEAGNCLAAKLSGCQRTAIGILPALTGNREPWRTPFTVLST
jgi:hypothetical protein